MRLRGIILLALSTGALSSEAEDGGIPRTLRESTAMTIDCSAEPGHFSTSTKTFAKGPIRILGAIHAKELRPDDGIRLRKNWQPVATIGIGTMKALTGGQAVFRKGELIDATLLSAREGVVGTGLLKSRDRRVVFLLTFDASGNGTVQVGTFRGEAQLPRNEQLAVQFACSSGAFTFEGVRIYREDE